MLLKIKKKYIIITMICVIAIVAIVCLLQASNYSIAANTISSDTNQLPTIIIDSGHGGEDGGAVGDDGTLEKDINLQISLCLEKLFITNGYKVVLTRDGDYAIYDKGCNNIKEKKISDMKNRLAIFNSSENNIVISVHQNKFTESKYSGTQIFYSPNNKESLQLAESIKQSVTGMLQPNNSRETKSGNKSIYLLWNSKVPSVIVECGFLSNYNERELLKTAEYQNKMAFTIFCGFLEYINTK
ncbi:MAG TPA: hypothetical protein GX401_07510 [Clostridiales bacterium]|nr:hypothetical protein [Clostridiales bacterium]